MIKNGFRTGKKGYRKDLSVMKYNRTDEENINNVVTGMRWRDIKDIFKRNADNETKRIHFGSNYYQCRINSNGICIGAKDICNPEMLDLTEVKEYIQNAKVSRTVWQGQFERYYSINGAAYVNNENNIIRTSFAKEEFKGDAKEIMEVLKKYGI